MRVGYYRATGDEGERLAEALKSAGCILLYRDRIGTARRARPAFAKALEVLKAGDTLVVSSLEDLGALTELAAAISHLTAKEIWLTSITEPLETNASTASVICQTLNVIAQLYRRRVRISLDDAKPKRKKPGRKAKLDNAKIEHARQLMGAGIAGTKVARRFGVSRSTLYHALQKR